MIQVRSEYKMFEEIVESLKDAIQALSHLIHESGQPVELMHIRDTLMNVRNICIKSCPHNNLMAPRIIAVK